MNIKLITSVCLVGTLCAAVWHYQDEINLALMTNDHNQVAYQFWLKESRNIQNHKAHNLPVKNEVVLDSLDYSLSSITEQNGKFFFDTTLSFNGDSPIALFTVVESIKGKWTVNLDETFSTINSAALTRSTNVYSAYLNNASDYLDTGLKIDLADKKITPEQHEKIDAWIDSLFLEPKAELKQRYISNL